MTGSHLVGSAAWTGGQEYQDEYSERITQFSDRINKEALVDFASSLRDNQPFTLSDIFFCRELQFRAQDRVRRRC